MPHSSSSSIVHFPSGGVFLAASGAARFTKEVLRVGRWVHPDTGQRIAFDEVELERLAAATNQWINLGNKVWFSSGPRPHNADALRNIGFWSRFRVDAGSLVADVDVPAAEVAEKIGQTITDVSAGIRFDVNASTGEHFDAVIVHVAATPAPVIPGQDNFVRLARELDAATDAQEETPMNEEPVVDQASAVPEEAEETTPEEEETPTGSVIDQIRSILQLPADADEPAIIDALRRVISEFAPPPPEAPEEPAADPMTPMSLSRDVELSRLASRVSELETENAKVRQAAAEREVEIVRERTVELGRPMSEDVRRAAIKLFKGGLEKEARQLLDLSVERAGVKTDLSVLPSPGARAQGRADAESDAAAAEMLLARGYTVKRDPQTGRIVEASPPHAKAS